ncbi:MAG TPA: hypothetical protein VM031_01445 [Phycisphaerae bacterium]|nr:hypothetical protein [Phycisphaerae bacterium]
MTRRELHDILEPPRYTRAWWLARGRSALWVAVVTVLVWIYADVEFTDEKELSATIQLSTPAAGKLVLLSRKRVAVSFKVQGRRSALDRLEQHLHMPKTVVRYQVAEGDTEISTRDVLNRSPLFLREGLTCLSASPSSVKVRLDRKISVPDIPVKFEYTGAFPSKVTIEPPKMDIRVAKTEWEQVKKAEPSPVLRTVSVALKSGQSDKPFDVEVIRRIAGVPVEPERLTVTVTVKIAQLTETEELTVPVQVVSPTNWLEDGTWQQYVLKRQNAAEWRAKIQVTGTRKHLDQLKGGAVQAYIVLTDDDKKPVSWLTRQVVVHLPRELNLSRLGTGPSVTFKLEKIPAAGTP